MVGLYTGGSMILINPVVMDIVGLKAAATGFGLAMLMMGVGGFIGPPIAGDFLCVENFSFLKFCL